ncbi:MAG: long-chain fatty acid--CoA ligase [Thermodesulfobacteriota bacterium]|nr:long-chain fatty acid--CoA ligase [Thermodesulfobacteriota bacterium]
MSHETLLTYFQKHVKEHPDQVAIRHKDYGIWHDVTWRQYGEKVRQVAMGLISLDFKKGECVSIISENRPEWVYADFGIMSAGGVTAGVYATNSPEQCGYIVQNSGSRFYFAENEEQFDKTLKFRKDTPCLEKVIVMEMEGLKRFKDTLLMSFDDLLRMGKEYDEKHPGLFEQRLSEVKPDDLAVLIYTSGTTGPPKGAMLTHSNLLYMSEAMEEANPIRDGDETLSYLPLCHVFEQLFTVMINVRFGTVCNFIESPDTVMDNMKEVSPTVTCGVPRIWEKYASGIMIRMSDATWLKRMIFKASMGIGMKYAGLKLNFKPIPLYLKTAYLAAYVAVFRKLKERLGFDRVRVAYSGAAPISPDVLKFFNAIGLPLVEGYGQTEGTGVTSVSQKGRLKIGKVGQPLPGAEVKIAEDGEILVKGPGIFKGYFKNPEATAETLKDGWLHSGDVGELDADGFLKITDRKKDLIITAGGKNIAPQNIENQLKFSSYINDAVVIGDRKKFLVALIAIDEENVIKYAQDHKIQFGTYGSLTQAPEIKQLIQTEVDRVNKSLAQVEQVKKFAIIPKKLYEEDGEVTPTMKVKRKSINEAYKDIIEKMYKGGE